MKQVYFLLFISAMLFSACSSEETTENNTKTKEKTSQSETETKTVTFEEFLGSFPEIKDFPFEIPEFKITLVDYRDKFEGIPVEMVEKFITKKPKQVEDENGETVNCPYYFVGKIPNKKSIPTILYLIFNPETETNIVYIQTYDEKGKKLAKLPFSGYEKKEFSKLTLTRINGYMWLDQSVKTMEGESQTTLFQENQSYQIQKDGSFKKVVKPD